MNAFPPPKYVSSGIYRLVSHPIYVGFTLACIGAAIATGSGSGLWLVSPAVAVASAALVLGYELPDMEARFRGVFPGQRLFPIDDQSSPSALERVRCYLTVLLPWFVFYEAFVIIGIPPDARTAYLPCESRLAVLPWTNVFYASVYVVVLLIPGILRTRHDLGTFSKRALLSMIVVFPAYLALPLIASPRPFITTGFWGSLLRVDRSFGTAAAAFPSYHVIWAFLAAEALGSTRLRSAFWRAWAVLVSASCVTTGMHAVVDVIAGLAVVLLVLRRDRVWSFLRNGSEEIANSWEEWRLGPVRIINHGMYAAAGVAVGVFIIDTLLGPGNSVFVVAVFAGGCIGAALWAQVIEGSTALLRPLGFYGGMLGTVGAAICFAQLAENDMWPVLSALAVAAPWIQGIGRLRCLVQGCCHGRPAAANIGIHYTHSRSRVLRIDSLRGVPLHATPLYSILWNAFVAVVVGRLYLVHVHASLVCGVYLILSGAGRFVEEAYRGEPQTPVVWGLRLYQWMALTSVVGGAIVSVFSSPQPAKPVFRSSSLWVAVTCGISAWIVSGVDFPESNRRFARLT